MITIANADARHIPLPDESVQCVVTSTPYWGLRDYGTAKWEGGSAECDHKAPLMGGVKKSTLNAKRDENGWLSSDGKSQPNSQNYKDICAKCGARRIDAQIGLERTPAAYVASIVAVMRECWRVLKPDGVLWLNLGDSYASGEIGRHDSVQGREIDGKRVTSKAIERVQAKNRTGLKSKDLVGIPWRVAFALQDDGWYLRQDIIWHKPNPMPESVTDRCTKAHEYIFLLTKSARYYYDAEAIKEPLSINTIEDRKHRSSGTIKGARITDGKYSEDGHMRNDKGAPCGENGDSRNRRSVWTVTTSPYSGAHFATFPPALVEPMILAGSRRGDVVLDPFAGSGTVGKVAVKHGRRCVMLDLNLKYIDLQFERTNGVQVTLL